LTICTAFYTSLQTSGLALERRFFTEHGNPSPSWDGLPEQTEWFHVESPHGSHYCRVSHMVESATLDQVQSAFPSQTFPVHLVKLFAYQVAGGLEALHEAGYVYAGLAPQLIATIVEGRALTNQLDKSAPAANPSASGDQEVPVIASEPLQSRIVWDEQNALTVEEYQVVLYDFSCSELPLTSRWRD
jgi:hypothetical protein